MKARTKIESAGRQIPAPEPNRVPSWIMPLVKAGLILVDGMLAFGCFALAFYFREQSPLFADSGWTWSKEFLPYAGVALMAIPVRILSLYYERVYRLSGAFSHLAELIKVLKAVLIGSLFLITFTFLFRGGFAFRDFSYSRGVFALDFALAIAAFTIFHLGLRYVQTAFRRRDINLIPTLIVGTNRESIRTFKELKERPDLGFRVIGVISTESTESGPAAGVDNGQTEDWAAEFDQCIIGELNELPLLIRELAIQEVIITDNEIPGEKLFETMLESGRKNKVEFRLAPSLFSFMPQKTSVEQIGILPMVRLFREPLSDAERFIKRISDVALSAFLISILSPLWVLISIAIKLDSKGSVLFRQERVGMDGRKFICYKFRTMEANADESLHREAYRKNVEGISDANAGDQKSPVFGKVRTDPRITRAGRILRRSSLDELPQLINVINGDMSIVGPRPPIPYEVGEYDIWHRQRLDMKPGITGLWQVSGRNRLTFEEMVRIDLYYIENWTLWLDLKIILLTLPAMLRGDGEK